MGQVVSCLAVSRALGATGIHTVCAIGANYRNLLLSLQFRTPCFSLPDDQGRTAGEPLEALGNERRGGGKVEAGEAGPWCALKL